MKQITATRTFRTEIPEYVHETMIELGRRGSKIAGIKFIRSYVREQNPAAEWFGLKEAKDYFEAELNTATKHVMPYYV